MCIYNSALVPTKSVYHPGQSEDGERPRLLIVVLVVENPPLRFIVRDAGAKLPGYFIPSQLLHRQIEIRHVE